MISDQKNNSAQQKIDSMSISNVLIAAMGLLAAIFMVSSKLFPLAISQSLLMQYHISPQQLGFISFSYFYAYVVTLVIAGLILDFVGPKRILILIFAISSLTFGVMAARHSLQVLVMGRLISGFCGAFIFIGVLKLVRYCLPAKFFPIFIGIFVALMFLTPLLNSPLFAVYAQTYGVASLLYLLAAVGAVLLILMLLLKNTEPLTQAYSGLSVADVKQLLLNRNIWLLCVIACMTSVMVAFFSQYAMLFLNGHHDLTKNQAAQAIAWGYIGLVYGVPIMAFLSQRLLNRKWLLATGLLIAAASLLAIIFHASSYAVFIRLFFVFGFFAASPVILYLLVHDSSNRVSFGLAFSLFLIFSVLGNALLTPVIGMMYSHSNDPGRVLSIIPILLFAAALLALLLSHKPLKQHREVNKLHPIAYLKNAWDGKLGLGRSFWVVFVWGALVWSFVLSFVATTATLFLPGINKGSLTTVTTLTTQGYFLWLFPVLFLAYLVFAAAVVWRCGKNRSCPTG